MSERISVPLIGSNVVGESQPADQPAQEHGWEDGVYVPRQGGKAAVRLQRAQERASARASARVETEPVWETNKFGATELKMRPVEAKPNNQAAASAPNAAGSELADLRRQADFLTGVVSEMARHHLGNGYSYDNGGYGDDSYGENVTGMRGEAPNPLDYDVYSDEGLAEFHKANAEYMNHLIEKRLEPYGPALEDAKWRHQYNQMVREHGDERNFKHVMNAALEMVADSGGKLSIPEAFAKANDPGAARLGQRGNGHLPQELRGGKNGRRRNSEMKLGAIMMHNRQVGRVTEIKKRSVR